MGRRLIHIGETIAYLTAEDEYFLPAEDLIHEARRDIQKYIKSAPWFWSHLEPLEVDETAPTIVQTMADAAARVGVGPMAAVAGAIAQYVVAGLVELGAEHVIFDNGGDIAMYLAHPIVAGVYAGPNNSMNLGLEIDTTYELLGLCTSSATVGHSLSFGRTDAAIVFSKNVALADAAATALGNKVTLPESSHIMAALQQVLVDGVLGGMVIIGDMIGIAGDMPRTVAAEVDPALIAKV